MGTNQEDFDLDYNMIDMPLNSSEPIWIAAEVFRDTMLAVGIVTEEVAEMARIAFYAMR